ncbi:MAG: PP2C family protein-serine/threonine phosphatase [Terriglobia bacterium]
MRDRIYLAGFLIGAGMLLYLGRGLLQQSELATWGLTFGGTSAVAVLVMTLYRVQHELRASRRELARKEAELSFALQVQQALFPQSFPAHSGLEFSAVCVPARGISGDYYDVIPLPDGRLALAIADVSGKGISAAILMSNVHAVLRMLASSGRTPGGLFADLNRHLLQVSDNSQFITIFYAEWDRATRRLHYINAGHLPALLFGRRERLRLRASGPPLGLFEDAAYTVGEVELSQGDLLALYSDGVTEAGATEGREFGEERLISILAADTSRPLIEIQRRVVGAARDWWGKELEDDMTLLLVRATPLTEEAS